MLPETSSLKQVVWVTKNLYLIACNLNLNFTKLKSHSHETRSYLPSGATHLKRLWGYISSMHIGPCATFTTAHQMAQCSLIKSIVQRFRCQ